MENKVVLQTNIPGAPAPKRGKVRDIYDLGDKLLIVVTDRLSAFDVIMPNGIPDKGVVLNQISLYWFKQVENVIANHVLSSDLAALPEAFRKCKDQLENRFMIVKKARPLAPELLYKGFPIQKEETVGSTLFNFYWVWSLSHFPGTGFRACR